jgi:hypothetical protein
MFFEFKKQILLQLLCAKPCFPKAGCAGNDSRLSNGFPFCEALSFAVSAKLELRTSASRRLKPTPIIHWNY